MSAAASLLERLADSGGYAVDLTLTEGLHWVLQDPAGQGIDTVRPIRDAIRHRVETLVTDLLTTDKS